MPTKEKKRIGKNDVRLGDESAVGSTCDRHAMQHSDVASPVQEGTAGEVLRGPRHILPDLCQHVNNHISQRFGVTEATPSHKL